ncbi:hypothetical protein EJB05_12547, partial [Eragrostis curvula]
KPRVHAWPERPPSPREAPPLVLGLVAVQLGGAAYMVVVSPVLALGLDPLFLVAVGSLCTGVLTLPSAVKLERCDTMNTPCVRGQVEMAVGAEQPAASAVRRAVTGRFDRVPGADAARHEDDIPGHRLRHAQPRPGLHLPRRRLPRGQDPRHRALLGRRRRQSVLQSPAAPRGHALHWTLDRATTAAVARTHRDWAAGCLFLLGAVLVLSGTIVLQVGSLHCTHDAISRFDDDFAKKKKTVISHMFFSRSVRVTRMQAATMIHFPAPFTLCSVTSLIGAVLTAAFQVVTAGRFSPGTPQISLEIVLSLVLVGGQVSSACIMFQTWAIEKKGPVMVSMFSPTQTVGSAIFSALFVGRVMQPGSILGMVFLFSGLYVVLWAKKKEGQVIVADRMATDLPAEHDMEKSLLFHL